MINESKEISQAELEFLEGILQRNHSFAQQLDTYADIMIALSTAIFIFSFSQLRADYALFWVVLGLTGGIVTIVALLMIKPPAVLRKKGQVESIMFKTKIASFGSAREYEDSLTKTLRDRQGTIEQYSREIYNVTKYYYEPKKFLFRIARNVLLLGIVLTIVLFAVESLVQ